MIDDYAERRREYVAKVRNSFDRTGEDTGFTNSTEEEQGSFSFFKLQFMVAAAIFVLFLFWKFDGSNFYGRNANEIIDIVADNHYFTSLQEYVLVKDQAADMKRQEPEDQNNAEKGNEASAASSGE